MDAATANNSALVLQLLINSITQLAAVSAIIQKAMAEGRDVNEDELAAARAAAMAANQALAAA